MFRSVLKCAVALSAVLVACSTAAAQTFSNNAQILIPAGAPALTSGGADPYPSEIVVAGVSGPVCKVTVTLHGFSHTFSADLFVLLVGPEGQSCLLMGQVGGGSAWMNDTVTFEDLRPPITSPVASGIYRPTGSSPFDLSGAPPGPYASTLGTFDGTNPNGTWELYIQDASNEDIGEVASGWSLSITTGIEVTNTNNSGAGSLRSAIALAEANPGLDTVCFSIPGAGPHIIALDSELEMIDNPLIIDGLTQPGASHDAWPPTLQIVLDGTNAGNGADGLEFNGGADGSVVRGLVIRNFDDHGIILDSADECRIQCNFIGVDSDGQTDAGNGGDGVRIVNNADDNAVGVDGDGMDDGKERNLISGNGGVGVRVADEDSEDNRISGNFIGVNAAGTSALRNDGPGVFLDDSGGHLVGTDGDGTSDALEGNLISGNGDQDDESDAGILIRRSSNCVVAGNLVGVGADGLTAIPNIADGICISGTFLDPSNNNRIGTNADGLSDDLEKNVFSGNDDDGVDIGAFGGASAQGNRIAGNCIGVGADGMTPVPNGEQGVDIEGDEADDNFIGFDQSGADASAKGNIIAHNTEEGVVVRGSTLFNAAQGNWIRGNSIHSNGALGIDLGDDGVTPNDDGDSDNGANEFKNFPIITSIVGNLVSGTYNSVANKTYDIDIYQSTTADPSGHGEGEFYLGSTTVTTDGTGNGNWSLNVVFRSTVNVLSATATDADPSRGTSEFGQNIDTGVATCILECPDDITVPAEPGVCSAEVEFGPILDEDCISQGYTVICTIPEGPRGGTIEIISPHTFPVGTTEVTCQLFSPLGELLDECTFLVTVVGVDAPTITCPDNIEVENDAGLCGASVEFMPVISFPCDDAASGLFLIICTVNGQPITSPHFFPVGVTTVECCLFPPPPPPGDDGEPGVPGAPIDCCTFTVTVTDDEDPVLVCRQDVELEAGECGNVVLTVSDLVESFTDNCPFDCCDPMVMGDFSGPCGIWFEPLLECPLLNTPIVIAVSGMDCHGNTATCTATVIIRGDDCNNNGRDDACDICSGTSLDCNDNWVPDECECFWCNVAAFPEAGPAQPDVNAQLSHLGGGTPCGEKVADDFYLEPGCAHRITAVRGRLLTNSHAALRRARVELYEDCNGKPADEPFFAADYNTPSDEAMPSEVIHVVRAADGFSVVTYRFDLCDACIWLEGGKTYWVSIIGLPDNIDMTDLSYWLADDANGRILGNVPVKRSGTPGSTWGSCTFGPWESLEDCCIGCVNMDFCIDGYSCPILWDNGRVDLMDRGGSPSGAHQQYNDRTADSFVVKTCEPADVCLIEAWIWTNCAEPVCGFIELYEDLGCDPRLADEPFVRYECGQVDAERFDETLVMGGRTFHLWRLRVKDPRLLLAPAHNYWVSAGARSAGNFNANSFFAWSTYGCDPCNGTNTFRITPGQHRTLRPPATEWADANPTRDFAFTIAVRGPDAIPSDEIDPPVGGTPDCAADANADGQIAVDDIFTFLAAWFAGCP